LGVGAPRISIPDAGVLFGKARQISLVGRRYQLTDSLVWQKDSHGLRFGFDWEHTKGSAQSLNQEPATINLYSPREVRQYRTLAPAAEPITLPASFLTLTDILRLPLRSFQTSVGPGALVMRGFRKHRFLDAYRLFASDTWRLGQQLTVNFGLGWSYEPNSFRADLTKPRLLTAILGDALNVAPAQKANVSPHFGFAWATRDGKTVIRGGAGRYFDPIIVDLASIVNERHALSPAGTGRRSNIPGSSIVYGGSPLEFIQRPTPFTAADLLAILPGIRADLERKLNPDNRDFTFRNLDLNKTGLALSDPSYEAAYALHFNLGVQRELAQDIVLSTDFAVRRFVHTPLFGIDYNRFNRRPQGPVIPRCTEAQRNDLSAVCSTGPITFDNTSGIATYRGLLVRLEKRFSRGTQFLVSYALANYTGTVGPRGPNQPASGFNNDNWFENYGPLPSERRHVLNLSGFVNLPWRFQASFALSASSRPPFLAYVNGMDFNGDGTQEDLLPGSRVNQFNRGLGKDDLPALVEGYNQQFANKRTLGGQTAPLLVLPANYSFHDNLFTQDVRLSRTFSLGSERVRLLLFGEVFNLFNIANLLGYSGNIANPAQFGQPGERFSQIFGSGGPRAFQLGMRVSF
jgi:hypothetical protein